MKSLFILNIERNYVVDKKIVVNTIAKSSTELYRSYCIDYSEILLIFNL